MLKVDRTNHSPAVKRLRSRSITTFIVAHHLGTDINKDGETTVTEAIDFFTRDPEGIATVAVPGLYKNKLDLIHRWRAQVAGRFIDDEGRDQTDNGLVPYHFLVASDGAVSRMLPLDVVGAHAGSNWNGRSVAVCFLGDFSKQGPSPAELSAGVALCEDIRAVYPLAQILSHDECMIRDGIPPKGCPGKLFPLDELRSRVRRVPQ